MTRLLHLFIALTLLAVAFAQTRTVTVIMGGTTIIQQVATDADGIITTETLDAIAPGAKTTAVEEDVTTTSTSARRTSTTTTPLDEVTDVETTTTSVRPGGVVTTSSTRAVTTTDDNGDAVVVTPSSSSRKRPTTTAPAEPTGNVPAGVIQDWTSYSNMVSSKQASAYAEYTKTAGIKAPASAAQRPFAAAAVVAAAAAAGGALAVSFF